MAVKSCYEVLEISPTASPGEIRHAFRRALARYHPDKVQHLGAEFHEIAAAKTAEITEAYRTLSNPSARADYDSRVAVASAPSRGDWGFSDDRAEAMELVRRAVLGRVRQALQTGVRILRRDACTRLRRRRHLAEDLETRPATRPGPAGSRRLTRRPWRTSLRRRSG